MQLQWHQKVEDYLAQVKSCLLYIPGLWSAPCIIANVWGSESSTCASVVLWRRFLHQSLISHTSHIHTVGSGLLNCAHPSKKSGVCSSIRGSTPRIDSLKEERIRFISHYALLNFTAQPKSNQFSLFDFSALPTPNNVTHLSCERQLTNIRGVVLAACTPSSTSAYL